MKITLIFDEKPFWLRSQESHYLSLASKYIEIITK